MKIRGIICPNCFDFVFSRSHYDCRRCTCGQVYVDGGQHIKEKNILNFQRAGFTYKVPIPAFLMTEYGYYIYYMDWNLETDILGIISYADCYIENNEYEDIQIIKMEEE